MQANNHTFACAMARRADGGRTRHGHDIRECLLASMMPPSVRLGMSQANARRHVSPEEFLVHPSAAGAAELVRGDVRVMTPASAAHGIISGTIFAALNAFVEAYRLGYCFPDNTGFLLPGLEDTVRSPDVAFVRSDRIPAAGIGPGWMAVAPDIVVEILSPSESNSVLDDKCGDYRATGTRLIWVVDPIRRGVTVHHEAHAVRWVAEVRTGSAGNGRPTRSRTPSDTGIDAHRRCSAASVSLSGCSSSTDKRPSTRALAMPRAHSANVSADVTILA